MNSAYMIIYNRRLEFTTESSLLYRGVESYNALSIGVNYLQMTRGSSETSVTFSRQYNLR